MSRRTRTTTLSTPKRRVTSHDEFSEIKTLLKQNLESINQRHDDLENKLNLFTSSIITKLDNIEATVQGHVQKNSNDILVLQNNF